MEKKQIQNTDSFGQRNGSDKNKPENVVGTKLRIHRSHIPEKPR